MLRFVAAVGLMALLSPGIAIAEGSSSPISAPRTNIVLIAGTKSHGPGDHEYERGMRLLKQCLDTSPNVEGLNVEVHTDGWPDDPSTLEDADTIVLFSDGSDRDEQAHPLLREDRLATLDRLMARGVGFVAIHYTVFVPSENGGAQFLDWIGGFFDYETGDAPNGWYSKIQHVTTTASPAAEDHPINRGVEPFQVHEEYYYNIRFREDDDRLVPILEAPMPGEEAPEVVAWAVERADGGRGFGYTGGHFHANWGNDNARKVILNAIVWTAGMEVPPGGVASTVPPEALDINTPLSQAAGTEAPIRAGIVTGPQHPAHDHLATTQALREVLNRDPRLQVTVIEGLDALGDPALADFDVIVLNTMNWERPGLSDQAQEQFLQTIRDGTGLVVVHFANGAFGDWPEYRKLARRVWVDGKSNHDPHGPFRVEFTEVDHPITRGLSGYDTTDELYFHQQGEEPIEPLAMALSKVTGRLAPMAFAYKYGDVPIFQTVLGHDAAAIRNPGTAELIRRGCAWAAGREVVPPSEAAEAAEAVGAIDLDDPPEGRFGRALDPRRVPAAARMRPEYREPPLTVECWAKLDSKAGFNLFVASDPKESSTHWEIYSGAQTGAFEAYLPGKSPAIIRSGRDIVDGRWHYLAMIYEPDRVRLYVDAELVADEPLAPGIGEVQTGALHFGGYPPHGLGCDGLVDEVRISRGVRAITDIPDAPFEADETTIGLWHFDTWDDGTSPDASALDNPAVAGLSVAAQPQTPGPRRDDALDYRADDPRLKVVLIDRSPDESFLAVRADATGRLFVGGREALFVYEPDDQGGYRPRQKLYRFPPDSWITDIEIRGDDLYVMTVAALYQFPGARTHREGLEPTRLIWGIPVDLHVTYHGLAWGPEGDLYFASGDPLLNYGDYQNRPDHWGHWTLFTPPEGTSVPFTGQGGIFRCRPDGSDFQVVATGTRGSCGLVFDRRWNLFTNDNDHESQPADYVPARLLHVTPRADFSWPRGWMASKTPDRFDVLETMNKDMGREVPVGQWYYDEPFLPAEYRDNLLLARWGQRRLDRYTITPRGASFRGEEQPLLEGEGTVRPVGVTVGRGGRIFATISYMQNNEWSPKYPSDLVMITTADDPDDHPFEAIDLVEATPDRLWSELSHPSWERRYRAHQEILRRGGGLLDEAARRLANTPVDDPAIHHLPWLAGAGGSPDAGRLLRDLAGHDDPEIRLQALRVLAEFPNLNAKRDLFIQALEDSHPQVVLAAIHALFDHEGPLPETLIQGPARSRDTYLRQASAFLLAKQATIDELERRCRADDPAVRLAGVLALGTRLTVPPPISTMPDALPLRYESPNALFEVPYAGETIHLRELGRVGSFTIAEWWRIGRNEPETSRLFNVLMTMLDDDDDGVRLQAAYYLALLNDPRSEPLVARAREASVWNRLAQAPVTGIDQAWFVGPFPDEAWDADGSQVRRPEDGPIDLAAEYSVGDQPRRWTRLEGHDAFDVSPLLSDPSASTVYAYFRLQTSRNERMRLSVHPNVGATLWHNGRPVPPSAEPVIGLNPGSNDILIHLPLDPTSPTVSLAYRATGPVVATLPENLGLATLAERLRDGGSPGDAEQVPPEFLAIDWDQAVAEGDPERGRKLFGADALGCVKCHAITDDQDVPGGPSLADAARRFTVSHLVESILRPSLEVAPVFRSTMIATHDGEVLTGLVVSETEETVELLLPDATRRAIPIDEVEERQAQDVSPMPAGLVQTPDELRDLLAYLLSANPQAP